MAKEQRKRVGIWIRVSTEDQAQGESPEHHEKRARHYAEAKSWEVVEVYSLEAVSGKSVLAHPEATRMLDDMKSSHIEALIFSKLARLARNTRELLDIADLFREHGADLVSLQESIDTSSPAGRLFYTMIAAMAQWEREEIAERVAASVPIRAKLGKPLGGQAPFGYQWNEDKKLVPHPDEAPVRRLLHELFLEHRRKKTVARILNEAGYRTRKGAMFSDTTVERLLRDPTAKGERRANYTRSTGEGKHWQLKPESEWVRTEVPAILSESLWNQCYAILEEQRKRRKPPARKSVHLFSGLTFCHCGGKMYVPSNTPKYVCYKCRNKIPLDTLEGVFHEQLRAIHADDAIIAHYLAETAELASEKEQLLKTLEGEIARLHREMDKVYRLYLEDRITPDGFAEKYRPMEDRLAQLNDEIPALQAEVDLLHIQCNSQDQILADAEDLYRNWPSMPFEDKRALLEIIIDRIVIEEGEVAIELGFLPSFREEIAAKGRRNFSPALPFCHVTLRTTTPDPRYPKELKTLGDHLLARRLDLGLRQIDVAGRIGVDHKTIINWESNARQPAVRYQPAIDDFLGYCLVELAETDGVLLRLHRIHRGLSHRDLARLFGVDPATISRWETGERVPGSDSQELLRQVRGGP